MRYPASEKLEIIRLVEQSHLPARRTLETLGILRSTFYRWYDRYQAGGPEALEDRSSTPNLVWNRIPDLQCCPLGLVSSINHPSPVDAQGDTWLGGVRGGGLGGHSWAPR